MTFSLASSSSTTPARLLRQPRIALSPYFAALRLATVLEPSSASLSDMVRSSCWSRCTHAQCWQHHHVPSFPVCPRTWQIWCGTSRMAVSTRSSLTLIPSSTIASTKSLPSSPSHPCAHDSMSLSCTRDFNVRLPRQPQHRPQQPLLDYLGRLRLKQDCSNL
jgi:hypothetical protein